MKTKYFCDDCKDLCDLEEISYKYKMNVSGKYPVQLYVCVECEGKEEA